MLKELLCGWIILLLFLTIPNHSPCYATNVINFNTYQEGVVKGIFCIVIILKLGTLNVQSCLSYTETIVLYFNMQCIEKIWKKIIISNIFRFNVTKTRSLCFFLWRTLSWYFNEINYFCYIIVKIFFFQICLMK